MNKVWSVGMVVVNEEQVKIALSNGLTRKQVYDRIDMYEWPVEKAVSVKIPVRHSRLYTLKDVEEAKRNGIAYKTFISRLRIYGWSMEKAKTYPVKPQGKRSANVC